jgi:hypothetical protein
MPIPQNAERDLGTRGLPAMRVRAVPLGSSTAFSGRRSMETRYVLKPRLATSLNRQRSDDRVAGIEAFGVVVGLTCSTTQLSLLV